MNLGRQQPQDVRKKGSKILKLPRPPPPEIPKALQNRAKLNPICENC